MAQAKKKTTTKTAKKQVPNCKKGGSCANTKTAKKEQSASNTFFVVSMSVLAGALIFANLFMIMA